MTSPTLLPQLRALVAEVTRRDASRLGPDDDLVEALALDSMEALRVLALAEKRLGVRFPDDGLDELRTLRRIAEAVERCRKGGAP